MTKETIEILQSTEDMRRETPLETPGGRAFTRRTVSRLTRMTWPTSRTMYSGSSARFGSEVMPERASVLTWYWSMPHSSALRFAGNLFAVEGQHVALPGNQETHSD